MVFHGQDRKVAIRALRWLENSPEPDGLSKKPIFPHRGQYGARYSDILVRAAERLEIALTKAPAFRTDSVYNLGGCRHISQYDLEDTINRLSLHGLEALDAALASCAEQGGASSRHLGRYGLYVENLNIPELRAQIAAVRLIRQVHHLQGDNDV